MTAVISASAAYAPCPSPYRPYNAPPPYRYPHAAPPYSSHESLRALRHAATAVPRAEPAIHVDRRPYVPTAPTRQRSERIQAQQAISGFLRPAKKRADATGLHPLLGGRPLPVLFDVRFPDSQMHVSRQWAHRGDAATQSHCTALRIVSDDCPWTIDVRGAGGAPVTCAEVFRALYREFAVPLTDVEWALADSSRKRSILKANLRRVGSGVVKPGTLRRVDWLGKKTLFASMRRCTSTERRWLTYDDCTEVWEVKFESHDHT